MKSKLTFIIGLTFFYFASFGQSEHSHAADTTIFVDPLVHPTFPGGNAGLAEYIRKNFRWTQGQLTVEGIVFVEFVVDTDGKIKDVKVVRGLCESCDKEAARLVGTMPQWIPGAENGKKVNTRMTLPIKFGL